MSTELDGPAGPESVVSRFPTKQLPAPQVRDMPPPPQSWLKLIGPGIIAAGVGLASGEFILYPYIASQVGLVFVWAAAVGLVTQYFINMEIERYTLATGETALTGFSRYWRHWGLVFALMTFFANLWPGWATSSATIVTFLWGGNANYIAMGMLLVIGATLTLAAGRLRRSRAHRDGQGRRRPPPVRGRRHGRDLRGRLARHLTDRHRRRHPGERARLRPAPRRSRLRRRRRRAEPGARATGSATSASAWAPTSRASPAR